MQRESATMHCLLKVSHAGGVQVQFVRVVVGATVVLGKDEVRVGSVGKGVLLVGARVLVGNTVVAVVLACVVVPVLEVSGFEVDVLDAHDAM